MSKLLDIRGCHSARDKITGLLLNIPVHFVNFKNMKQITGADIFRA